MARPKKEKQEVVITDVNEQDSEIIEPTAKVVVYEDEPIKVDIQSEYDFLIDLLRAHEDGNWHGPASGLIRARLKLISNG